MRFAFSHSFSIAFPDAIHIPFCITPDVRAQNVSFYPCISFTSSSCSSAFPVKPLSVLTAPPLHRATHRSTPAWPGRWVAWASPHSSACPLAATVSGGRSRWCAPCRTAPGSRCESARRGRQSILSASCLSPLPKASGSGGCICCGWH